MPKGLQHIEGSDGRRFREKIGRAKIGESSNPTLLSSALFRVGVVLMLLVSLSPVAASATNETCRLPQDLHDQIAATLLRARVLTLADLSEDERVYFEKDHGDACPGLVKVDFYGDGRRTLAILLITKDKTKTQRVELIVAHEIGKHWTTRLLDTAGAVPAPVIWSQPAGRYRDIYGKKEIRARQQVIVLARFESWAILYSWTGRSVTKIWMRD